MRSASHLSPAAPSPKWQSYYWSRSAVWRLKAKIQVITTGDRRVRVQFGWREGARFRSHLQFFKLLVNFYVSETKHLKHLNCSETLDINISYWPIGKLVQFCIHSCKYPSLQFPSPTPIPTPHPNSQQLLILWILFPREELWPQNLTHENKNELSLFPLCFPSSFFMQQRSGAHLSLEREIKGSPSLLLLWPLWKLCHLPKWTHLQTASSGNRNICWIQKCKICLHI